MNERKTSEEKLEQPRFTVGILGAGQLGRMLALSGYPLGLGFRSLDITDNPPCSALGEYQRASSFTDVEALKRFQDGVDVITYEFENIPAEALKILTKDKPVFPCVRALEVSQDRLFEKQLFNQLGIETPKFAAVGSETELREAVQQVGLPAILKTRRFGYDGKGQYRLTNEIEIPEAWKALAPNAQSSSEPREGKGRANSNPQVDAKPLILEGFVPFDREVSVVAARSRSGEIAWYPLAQNTHRDGILRKSVAPAPNIPDVLEQTARGYVSRILRELDYVGVLALELFVVGNRILANEIAPRVHNSGHWTIDGSETSQFENHLRAILGLPLGSTAARGVSCMVNLIGDVPPLEDLLALSHLHIHLYGKAPREGRKVGHLTVTAETYSQLEILVEALPASIRPGA